MAIIRRCVGQWWLPGDAERKVGGVLEIDNVTGLRLEVTDELLAFGSDFEAIPVVHGAADGRPITLLDIQPANGPSTIEVTAQLQTTYQVARPLAAMVGIHLADAAEAVFNGLTVELTGLTAFAGGTGLQSAFTARPDTNERYRYTVDWTDPIEAQITEPVEATLGLHWNLTTQMGPDLTAERRSLQATETVAAQVESQTAQPWRTLLDPIRAVQDLVTVATQSPSLVMRRTLHINHPSVPGTIDIPYTIDLYFKGPSDAGDRPQHFDASRVIFTLETIDCDFNTLIERWLRLRIRLALCVVQTLTHRCQVSPQAEQLFADVTTDRRTRCLSQVTRHSIEIHDSSTEQSTGIPGIVINRSRQCDRKFGNAISHTGSHAQRGSCSLQRFNRQIRRVAMKRRCVSWPYRTEGPLRNTPELDH